MQHESTLLGTVVQICFSLLLFFFWGWTSVESDIVSQSFAEVFLRFPRNWALWIDLSFVNLYLRKFTSGFPPVAEIITWLPNFILSTQPLHYIMEKTEHNNYSILEKVHSSLIQILQTGLPSSVGFNCSRSSWTALSRYWLLSFSSSWIRFLAWAIFRRLSHTNFTLVL